MIKISQAELSRICEVNRSSVSRAVQRGRIVLVHGLIELDAAGDDPDAIQAAARQLWEASASPEPHHHARKTQIDEQKAKQPADVAPEPPQQAVEQVNLRYKAAMMREREAKAETAALELDERAGLLVERVEVEALLEDFGATLRNLLEGMPDKLSPVLTAHRGDVAKVQAELETAARELLGEISAHMQRKQAQQQEGRSA